MRHTSTPTLAKVSALLLAAVIFAALLSGCAARETVPVSSIVYELPENLPSGKYDERYAEKMSKTTYKYYSRTVYLSLRNDTLFLSDTDPYGGEVRSLAVPGGCFTGTQSGVSFRSDDGSVTPVINEACRGIFARDAGCILVTFAGGKANIYILDPASGASSWSRRLVTSLDGEPTAAALTADGSAVLIAIAGETPSLMRVGTDGRTSTLTSSELYGKLAVTSLLEWQGCVFCATKLGILRFDPTSEKETWFPLSVIDDNDN